MHRIILAFWLIASAGILSAGVAVAAEQVGKLEAGASVTLDTAKDDLTDITLKNASNQTIIVEASGATTSRYEIDAAQTIGTLGHFKGVKLTLTNKGAGPIEYKVGW